MRFNSLPRLSVFILLLLCGAELLAAAKPISLEADGSLHQQVVKPEMGYGKYLTGAKKVVVPIIAVAFESSAKAKVSHGTTTGYVTRSLETRLEVDPKTLIAICDQLQAIVEKDLAAEGFEVLPRESLDQDPLWMGIQKNGKPGEEIGDNFLSGFGGQGVMNRWYTAGNRPLFGTGSTGVMGDLATILKIAKEKNVTVLAYRFRIQYTQIDASNHVFFSALSGKNFLHMLSADLSATTPDHILGGLIKLKEDVTAGTDYMESSSGDKGHYVITANPERYSAGCLALIKAVSLQFAQALHRAQ